MYQIKLLGTDTEVFLKDFNGNYVPAVGLIGGTKRNPRPYDNEGSAVQEDNVMLEFNTKPAYTESEWVGNINKVLVNIFEELRAKNLTIDIVPSVEFTDEQLSSKQAQEMGCEGDYSAWTGEANDLINPMFLGNIRTAGGHIHISFSVLGQDPNMLQKRNLVRALDLTLGLPSVLLDDDERRRKYYGRPGAFRTNYEDRVEYRTLSNFWIKNDNLKAWAYNGVVDAIRRLNKWEMFHTETLWGEFFQERIEKAIKTSNKVIASDLIRTLNVNMP